MARMVRCGTPGTATSQSAGGRDCMSFVVTRLFVRQAASKLARSSVWEAISSPYVKATCDSRPRQRKATAGHLGPKFTHR